MLTRGGRSRHPRLDFRVRFCSVTGRKLNSVLRGAIASHVRMHALRLHAGGWRGLPEIQPDIPAHAPGTYHMSLQEPCELCCLAFPLGIATGKVQWVPTGV